jgi:hypothetical protein
MAVLEFASSKDFRKTRDEIQHMDLLMQSCYFHINEDASEDQLLFSSIKDMVESRG